MQDLKAVSFRHYISTRRYHQGRGSHAGWAFIAHALGDPDLPDPAIWQELRAYLIKGGVGQEMIGAANIVWRSYLSHISKVRKGGASNAFGQTRMIVPEVALTPMRNSRGRSCRSVAD